MGGSAAAAPRAWRSSGGPGAPLVALVRGSHAGSLLGGHSGRGLPGQGVHGPQELVGDAAGLAQPAQQRPVHRGRVVADRVLARKEQPGDGLWGDNTSTGYSWFSFLQQMVH